LEVVSALPLQVLALPLMLHLSPQTHLNLPHKDSLKRLLHKT
jgi:hypothetical protein